jgi:endonuclease-3
VATILAAQARDEKINQLTPALFQRYPDARAFAEAPLPLLAEELKPTGYYNQKARAVQGACRALLERHGGEVPDDLDALVGLPGVGRKTANVVLGNAFAHPDRVAVDTHVKRVSARLGLSRAEDPADVEAELERLIPPARRTRACHLMQFHGRRVCLARSPRCDACPLAPLCPSAGTRA